MKKAPEKLQLLQAAEIPQHDYSPKLQTAVSWLGDRYLLAEPVARRSGERTTWFVESKRWHPATRH